MQQPGPLPPGNPPLGLDGYCPVQLVEDMTDPSVSAAERRWTLGDRRWGVIHRGRTYLFSGPEKAGRFYNHPDRYAPALSGHDPVIAVEQGRMVPGHRAHGLFFQDRVYLFANEANLAKFERRRDYYADQVQQAMQASTHRATVR